MGETPLAFADLLRRLCDGCPEAARLLVARYQSTLLCRVRRLLHPLLCSLFDPLDLVQDLWLAFFSRYLPHCDFQREASLRAFLRLLARHLTLQVNRQRLTRLKYDLTRERSLTALLADGQDFRDPRQPDPTAELEAEERWQQLLAGRSERARQTLLLLRNGHTHVEVADHLGINEKTVRRLLLCL
jgi:RNA polymerase sigma factor (sigma-70 family)